MPRNWNKTKAFAHFGVTLDNHRWSWSGVSDDGGTVAMVLWQDAVKGQGRASTYADNTDLEAEWRRRPGHKARVGHLAHCQSQLGGRFRAIIAKARNVNDDPRSIASCFPQEGVVWQLDEFDEFSGAFTAHAQEEFLIGTPN